MDKNEVEHKIQNLLRERRGKVVARHTIGALFGMVADPVGTIGKLFFGAKDAVDQEKHKIEQDFILDLLCNIDTAITNMVDSAREILSTKSTIVIGEIVAIGKHAQAVTGVDIPGNSGPVEFKPGTKITARGEDVGTVTGLKIGGDKNKGN